MARLSKRLSPFQKHKTAKGQRFAFWRFFVYRRKILPYALENGKSNGAVKKLWLFFHGPSDCQKPRESARGAHEARAQWAKQRGVSPVGTKLRRRQWRKQAKRKSNEGERGGAASGCNSRR